MRTKIVSSSSLQKDMRARTAAPPKKRSPEGIAKAKANRLAKAVVNKILDKGLANSTWRSNNGFAYNALLQYREDMIADAEQVLLRSINARGAPRKTRKKR